MGSHGGSVANYGWVPVPFVLCCCMNQQSGLLTVKILNVLFLYRACVILGVIFLLSSICIVVKAIHDLSTRLLPEVVRSFFLNSFSWSYHPLVLPLMKDLLGKVGWAERE